MNTPEPRPSVVIVVGYFDWFSGYNETALATSLAASCDVEVVCSDRVNPTFDDRHLESVGQPRLYGAGRSVENGVTVTRFAAREMRSMVWSTQVRRYLDRRPCSLLIQVMPGQALPVAASLSRNPAPRVVLYGDNRAMWNHLGRLQRVAKGLAFAVSKGLVYTIVNRRARAVFGYTENTLARLRPYSGGRRVEILPLGFSPTRFYFDAALRRATRAAHGIADHEVVVLAAGKYAAKKRLDWLVEAFERLDPSVCSARLVLAGISGSDEADDFVAALADSPRADRISVVGFLDAEGLNAVFNAADLAVWPRNPAITIQQAMGTGLPVLLPRNDLVGHLLREEGVGRYFDPAPGEEPDVIEEALSATVGRLDSSDEARRRRAERNAWLGTDAIVQRLLVVASSDAR